MKALQKVRSIQINKQQKRGLVAYLFAIIVILIVVNSIIPAESNVPNLQTPAHQSLSSSNFSSIGNAIQPGCSELALFSDSHVFWEDQGKHYELNVVHSQCGFALIQRIIDSSSCEFSSPDESKYLYLSASNLSITDINFVGTTFHHSTRQLYGVFFGRNITDHILGTFTLTGNTFIFTYDLVDQLLAGDWVSEVVNSIQEISLQSSYNQAGLPELVLFINWMKEKGSYTGVRWDIPTYGNNASQFPFSANISGLTSGNHILRMVNFEGESLFPGFDRSEFSTFRPLSFNSFPSVDIFRTEPFWTSHLHCSSFVLSTSIALWCPNSNSFEVAQVFDIDESFRNSIDPSIRQPIWVIYNEKAKIEKSRYLIAYALDYDNNVQPIPKPSFAALREKPTKTSKGQVLQDFTRVTASNIYFDGTSFSSYLTEWPLIYALNTVDTRFDNKYAEQGLQTYITQIFFVSTGQKSELLPGVPFMLLPRMGESTDSDQKNRTLDIIQPDYDSQIFSSFSNPGDIVIAHLPPSCQHQSSYQAVYFPCDGNQCVPGAVTLTLDRSVALPRLPLAGSTSVIWILLAGVAIYSIYSGVRVGFHLKQFGEHVTQQYLHISSFKDNRVEVLILVVEFFQLSAFSLNSSVPWPTFMQSANSVAAISTFDIKTLFFGSYIDPDEISFLFFLPVIFSMSFIVITVIIVSKITKHDDISKINIFKKTLIKVGPLITTMGFVPVLRSTALTAACSTVLDDDHQVQFQHPDVLRNDTFQCWQGVDFLLPMIFSLIGLVFYTPLALSVQPLWQYLTDDTQIIWSPLFVIFLSIFKMGLVFTNVFFANYYVTVILVLLLFSFSSAVFVSVKRPCSIWSLNAWRATSLFAISWSAICALVAFFSSENALVSTYDNNPISAILFLVGLAVIGLFSCLYILVISQKFLPLPDHPEIPDSNRITFWKMVAIVNMELDGNQYDSIIDPATNSITIPSRSTKIAYLLQTFYPAEVREEATSKYRIKFSKLRAELENYDCKSIASFYANGSRLKNVEEDLAENFDEIDATNSENASEIELSLTNSVPKV